MDYGNIPQTLNRASLEEDTVKCYRWSPAVAAFPLTPGCCAVTEYAADSCALECKEQQESAQSKLTDKDTDGLAKLKVCPRSAADMTHGFLPSLPREAAVAGNPLGVQAPMPTGRCVLSNLSGCYSC